MSYYTYFKFRVPEGLLNTIFSPTAYDTRRACWATDSDVMSNWSDFYTLWLNGKIYNSNHKFFSLSQWLYLKPLLFYQIQTSHFTSQFANLFWLGRDFCALIPSEIRDPVTLSTERNSGQRRRDGGNPGHIFWIYGLFGKTFLRGSYTTGGNLFCPYENQILIRKKVRGRAAVKTLFHWLIIWSNPAKMIESSKESSRNLKVMSHSSPLTAGPRIMMRCLFSQGSVVRQEERWVWNQGYEQGSSWVLGSIYK